MSSSGMKDRDSSFVESKRSDKSESEDDSVYYYNN